MDVTKPYEFIKFGAMDLTKPYGFIGLGSLSARVRRRGWAAGKGGILGT